MSSLPPDPYKILGVGKDAQVAEIRSAHRKLILKCHPDKIQDAELKAQKADEFQRVQQAYELLSDDNERAKYDDQVKLAELRRQMQSKANTSSPRTIPKYAEFEIRTAEPRPNTYKTSTPTTPQMPPRSKTYHTYSRSYEEDAGRGPKIFETEIRTSTRRGATFSGEKPSKRERDREKERERERERDKLDRERRKEDARLAEKLAEKEDKEARRAERRKAEKARDKELRALAEEKKRSAKPYVESYEEEVPSPRSEKKKTSSSSTKKYEEKRERERERSLPRGEMPPFVPAQSREDKTGKVAQYAASYIEAARGKNRSGASRTAAYHTARSVQPPVPTPPPAPGQASVFPTPDDEEEVRRSSARTRRGSGDSSRPQRERSYRKPSRDAEEVAYIVHSSPSPRRAAQYEVPLSTSPQNMHPYGPTRTNTMPMDGYSRTIPVHPPRSRTFSDYGQSEYPRGRDRSRMQAQIDEESDDDEEFERERRRSERKHRSKKVRSPDGRETKEHRYHVNDGRTIYASTYSRTGAETDVNGYRYYAAGSTGYMSETRPSLAREASYMSKSSGAKFDKFKQSKDYGYGDVAYSEYPQQYHRDPTAALA